MADDRIIFELGADQPVIQYDQPTNLLSIRITPSNGSSVVMQMNPMVARAFGQMIEGTASDILRKQGGQG